MHGLSFEMHVLYKGKSERRGMEVNYRANALKRQAGNSLPAKGD